MVETNDSLNEDGGVDSSPWLKPLAELGEKEFSEVVKMGDLDEIEEAFYPHAPAQVIHDRLSELRREWLVSWELEQSFGSIGVLWDEKNQTGMLFLSDLEGGYHAGLPVESLDAEIVFPLVLSHLLFESHRGPIRVVGGTHLAADAAPGESIDLSDQNGSGVWDPEGFSVHNQDLVPQAMLGEFIRLLYEQMTANGEEGCFSLPCPTPEAWLERAYSREG